jgi:hypothetical protein
MPEPDCADRTQYRKPTDTEQERLVDSTQHVACLRIGVDSTPAVGVDGFQFPCMGFLRKGVSICIAPVNYCRAPHGEKDNKIQFEGAGGWC